MSQSCAKPQIRSHCSRDLPNCITLLCIPKQEIVSHCQVVKNKANLITLCIRSKIVSTLHTLSTSENYPEQNSKKLSCNIPLSSSKDQSYNSAFGRTIPLSFGGIALSITFKFLSSGKVIPIQLHLPLSIKSLSLYFNSSS